MQTACTTKEERDNHRVQLEEWKTNIKSSQNFQSIVMMKFQEAGSRKQEARSKKTLCLAYGHPRQLSLTLEVCSLPDFAICICSLVSFSSPHLEGCLESASSMAAWTVQDYTGLPYNHYHCTTLPLKIGSCPPCFQLVTHTGLFSAVLFTFHFLPSLLIPSFLSL